MNQEVDLKNDTMNSNILSSIIITPPIRPKNGTIGLELLKKNKTIEVENELVFWFVEELEKRADFSFCYHLDKFNKGWAALYKYEA